MSKWTNWSGSIHFHPQQVYEPKTEKEIIERIQYAHQNPLHVRPVGSIHSSSAIFETNNLLMSLKHISKLHQVDANSYTATVGAAMKIEQTGEAFLKEDMAISISKL